jgi:hypothetical protein
MASPPASVTRLFPARSAEYMAASERARILSAVLASSCADSAHTPRLARTARSWPSMLKGASHAMDAGTALAELKDAGLPITDSAVITETNDANNLIGRPGQYVSKVAFADSRLGVPIDQAEPGNEGGGSIEVFADGADAQVRSDYIQQTLQSLGPVAGTEYHFLAGPVLVRVSGELPPSVAAEYEAASAGLA